MERMCVSECIPVLEQRPTDPIQQNIPVDYPRLVVPARDQGSGRFDFGAYGHAVQPAGGAGEFGSVAFALIEGTEGIYAVVERLLITTGAASFVQVVTGTSGILTGYNPALARKSWRDQTQIAQLAGLTPEQQTQPLSFLGNRTFTGSLPNTVTNLFRLRIATSPLITFTLDLGVRLVPTGNLIVFNETANQQLDVTFFWREMPWLVPHNCAVSP